MRVLLTGASGYLGQHVLARLRERGCEIVLLGRSRPSNAEDLPWLAVDLLSDCDLFSVVRQARASHLLHLAWYTEHGKYWNSPINLYWVKASIQLLRAFTEQGGRHVLMAGTCAEYDWQGSGVLDEENTLLRPVSLYGIAKDVTRRLAEGWCSTQYKENRPTLAWAHVFFPFGPGEARQRMLPSLIEALRGRSAPFGVNAAAWRGMLPVYDAAEALVHLLGKGCDGRYNICSGQPVQIGEVVRILARLCDVDPSPILSLATARYGEPIQLVGNNERLISTGWRQRNTLEQGLLLQVEQQL